MAEGKANMDLSRVVALANGKGGAGKTSLVANLAGEFARAGSRTLVIDLDISANLQLDLGTYDHPDNDAGNSVFEAVTREAPLNIVRDVKEGIDWVPGGARLNWLVPMSFSVGPELPGGSVAAAWRAALERTLEADKYDMVLIDTAPTSRELQLMALAAAKWIVVPIKSDPASWDGLRVLGPLVKKARADNPELDWLGAVLFGHSSSATRVRQTVVENLAAYENVPLLEATVRASESTAQMCRLKGLLVHELAQRVDANISARLTALRAKRLDPSVKIPETVSATSTSLADDYAAIATELADLILKAEARA